MMKEEFEKMAGYEVSFEDYNNIIEPMYMATNLDKSEFVKVLDKKRFALKTGKQYVKEMKQIAQHLKKTCENYTDFEALEKLEVLAEEWRVRIGAYGCNIDKRYTMEHLGYGRGCSYPNKIEFYSPKYQTMDIINLI